ncbi:MAG: endolytic transglycosylase MltG [Terriglobia bacterium]
MKRFLKILLLAVIIVIVVAGAWAAKELYSPYKGYPSALIVVVSPGARAPATASLLVSRGVLARRIPFLLRYWLGRWHHETIKAGEYRFDRPMTAAQVCERLVRGEVYLHSVVIPEGSDRFDMARTYRREIGLDPAAFLAATSDPAAIRDLDPRAPSLEGYLFPDTYRFPRGVSARTVVETMLKRFRDVLRSQFPQAAGSGKLHGVVTLASLIEKETPNPAERPEIAGVFTRRLEKGMDLDCDPTVAYALRLANPSGDPALAAITASDLKTPSRYNTYVHGGLPPGPICSPGAASIRAAMQPAGGDALYFVSNNHGGHVFANTLAEHNRNVERYREQIEQQRRTQDRKTGAHR